MSKDLFLPTPVGSLLSGNATTFDDMNLSPDTSYTYRLRVIEPGGPQPFTAAAAASTQANVSSLLARTVSTSGIDLQWAVNAPGVGSLDIERSLDGGAYSPIATGLAAGVTTYGDSGLAPGSDCRYEIIAHLTGNATSTSAVADATTLPVGPGGALDPSFNSTGKLTQNMGGSDTIYEVLPQPDGSVVAVGSSDSQIVLARYQADGTLDPSFGTSGVTRLPCAYPLGLGATMDAHGNLLVAAGDGGNMALWRFDSSGHLDTTFGYGRISRAGFGGWSSASAVTVQGDGKIVLAGSTGSSPSSSDLAWAITRFNPDGSLDTTFGTGGKATLGLGGVDIASSVLVQGSGGIVVAGTSYGGGYAALARFTSTGTLDSTFGKSTTGIVNVPATYGYRITRDSLDSLSDGNLLLAGVNGGNVALYRFTSTGQADTSFGNNGTVLTDFGGVDYAYDLSVQSDQKIVIAGITAYDQSHINWITARYNPDGSLDPTFGNTGKVTTYFGANTFAERDIANALTILPDGQILMAGVADAWGSADWAIARYNGGDQTAAIATLTTTPASSTEIDLNWTLRATDATSIQVQRSTDGVVFTTIATLSGTTTSYADTDPTLTENTHYWYEVRVVQPTASTLSNVADAYTSPGAPTGLIATAGSGGVDLSWTNHSASSIIYNIEESTDGVNFSVIDETAAGATTYTDTNPGEGVTYYRVDAVNNDGSGSNPSAIASVTEPLFSPSDLSAQAVSASEIDLQWTNNSAAATGITILRSTNGSSFSAVATLSDATLSSFNDTGLSAGSHYYYEVEATQGSLSSAPSGQADDTTVPPSPLGLAVAAANPTELDLTWTATPGTTGYDIERAATGGTWQAIQQVAASDHPSYQDGGLWDGVTYSYQIDAYNNAGTSDYSAAVTQATPLTVPIAPSGVQAVPLSSSSIQLIWQNNAYNESQFNIYGSSDNNTWTSLGYTTPGTTTFTESGLHPSTLRYYEVKAYNAAGESAAGSASATTLAASSSQGNSSLTLPSAPAGLAVSYTDSRSVPGVPFLTFGPGAGGDAVSQFIIQRSRDGENFGEIDRIDPSEAVYGYKDYSAQFGENYTYRVLALGENGTLSPAATLSTTTMPLLVPAPFSSSTHDDLYQWADGSAITVHYDFTQGNWLSDPQNAPAGFKVSFYPASSPNDTTPVASLTAYGPDAWVTAHGLADGDYRVESQTFNGAGESSIYGPLIITVQNKAQGSLGAYTVDASDSLLTSHWPADLPGDANLEYSPDGNNWASMFTYTTSEIAPGASGYLRVWSRAADGAIDYSNAVAVSGPPLDAPTGLTATASAPGRIQLTWSLGTLDPGATGVAVGAMGQSVDVQRSEDGGTTFRTVDTVYGNSTGYTDTVSEGTHYEYRLLRHATVTPTAEINVPLTGTSAYSSIASAESLPNAPTDLSVTSPSPSEVDAAWIDTSDSEANTQLQLSTDPNFTNIVASGSVGSDVTSYAFTGLSASTYYYVRARTVTADAVASAYLLAVAGQTQALPIVSVTNLLDAAELGPDGQPSQGYFQFTRTGNLNQPLTVAYIVGDSGPTSATPGYEYKTLGGSVTFNAGIASVLVAVLPKEINLVEGTTSVLVNVVSSSTYTTDAYGGSATVNIVNTDNVKIIAETNVLTVGVPDQLGFEARNHYNRPEQEAFAAFSESSTIVQLSNSSDSTDGSGHGSFVVDMLTSLRDGFLQIQDAIGNFIIALAQAGPQTIVPVNVNPAIKYVTYPGKSEWILVKIKNARGVGISSCKIDATSSDPGLMPNQTATTNEQGFARILCDCSNSGPMKSTPVVWTITSELDPNAAPIVYNFSVDQVSIILLSPHNLVLDTDPIRPNHTGKIRVRVIDVANNQPVPALGVEVETAASDTEFVTEDVASPKTGANGETVLTLTGRHIGAGRITIKTRSNSDASNSDLNVTVYGII